MWSKPTTPEYQRWLRIRLSVAAYAYEYLSESLMDDSEFDRLSELVDTSISTGNDKLDTFFKEEFAACTGMWICKHPDILGLSNIYNKVWKDIK
jgi:hypothetical protein